MKYISDEQLAAIRAVCDEAVAFQQARECPECGGNGWRRAENATDEYDRIDCDQCDGCGKISLTEAFRDDIFDLADYAQNLIDQCLKLRATFTRPPETTGDET